MDLLKSADSYAFLIGEIAGKSKLGFYPQQIIPVLWSILQVLGNTNDAG